MIDSKSSVVRLILGFSMASWLNAGINFIILPIITRIVDPIHYGQIDMFITVCGIFVYASTLGMHQSYMRFYHDLPVGWTKQCLFGYAIKISVSGAIATAVLLLFFHDFFSNMILGEDVFQIPLLMALYILVNGVLILLQTEYRMKGDVELYTTVVVLLGLCQKFSYFAFVIQESVVFSISFMVLTMFILTMAYGMREKRLFNSVKNVDYFYDDNCILKYAVPFVPVMLLTNLNPAITKMLLNQYGGANDVGIYASAMSLVAIITLLQSGFNLFWVPFAFENYRNNQKRVQEMHLAISYCMTACGIMLICFQDILFLILGEGYRNCKDIYALLLVGPIFFTIGETLGIGINIEKKTFWNTLIMGLSVFGNFCLGMLCIPSFGLFGAALSTMSSALLVLMMKSFIGGRYYTVTSSPIKSASNVLIYLACAWTSYFFYDNPIYRIGGILFFLFFLTAIFKNEILRWKNDIMERISP